MFVTWPVRQHKDARALHRRLDSPRSAIYGLLTGWRRAGTPPEDGARGRGHREGAPTGTGGGLVAVGTAIADRPPHRSVRALLAHTAPTFLGCVASKRTSGPLLHSIPRSRASDQNDIPWVRTLHCLQGDGTVEGGEPAVIPNSQTKQICIRDFPMPADRRQPKKRVVRRRNRVRPEMVVRRGAKASQAAGHFGGCRFHRPIGRVAQNANAAIRGDRAGCPTVFSVPAEPAVRVLVVDVGRIEQSHQHVHVKKGNAHASVPQLVYYSEIGLRGAGLRHKEQNAIAHLLRCSGGEGLPGQRGDELPERHPLFLSQLPCAREEVVVKL